MSISINTTTYVFIKSITFSHFPFTNIYYIRKKVKYYVNIDNVLAYFVFSLTSLVIYLITEANAYAYPSTILDLSI